MGGHRFFVRSSRDRLRLLVSAVGSDGRDYCSAARGASVLSGNSVAARGARAAHHSAHAGELRDELSYVLCVARRRENARRIDGPSQAKRDQRRLSLCAFAYLCDGKKLRLSGGRSPAYGGPQREASAFAFLC